MDRPEYSWNQPEKRPPLMRVALGSVALGLILTLPLFFAAARAASSDLRAGYAIQEAAVWITAFQAVIVSFPWVVIVAPVVGALFGGAEPAHQLLMMGASYFVCIAINASFALRKWNIFVLAIIAILVAAIQTWLIADVK